MCAYSVFNTFPVYPLSAKPLILLAFCRYRYHTSLFNRPGMEKLMDMVKAGEINCIIVKDLSRFGRNYVDVGTYLEKVFPFLRVRFISVNDAYDSMDPHCVGSLESAFKNLLNDLYSKDCSVKVKNGKRTTAMQGKFQNPWAPYGYAKSQKDKSRLVVDPEAAQVVKRIFSLFLEGHGTVEIARKLNHELVPTRSVHKKNRGDSMRWQYAGEKNYWTDAAVRYILMDERYIGSVVYGRLKSKGVAAHRNIKAPEEDVIIVPNQHEKIVSPSDFYKVQEMFRRQTHYEKTGRPLTGKIKCGVCGHAMPLRPAKEPYFVCATKWYDSNFRCSELHYPQSSLYGLLLESLRQQVKAAVDLKKVVEAKYKNEEPSRLRLTKQIAETETAISRKKESAKAAFERFARGKMTEQEFLSFQQEYKQQMAGSISYLEHLREKLSAVRSQQKVLHLLTQTQLTAITEELTYEALDYFISEVRIYPKGEVEITWSFGEDFASVLERQRSKPPDTRIA